MTDTTTTPALLALAERLDAHATLMRLVMKDNPSWVQVHSRDMEGWANVLTDCGGQLRTLAAPSAGNAPPQVEYDRGLIAAMLNALITFGDKLAGFTYRSINDQIALLRAADDREAAGVHTAKATPGDAPAAFVNRGDSEANFIADGEHLNCPFCGGSGHVDDTPGDAEAVALVWHDGAPYKFYGEEWFIAKTVGGERVVLRRLPEEYAHDFTTADGTYFKEDRIKQWMQFPDSQFKSYTRPAPPVVDEVVAWAVDRDGDRTFPRIYATEA